jgi:NADP-dependent 3-hydroxy acid dehydrogenase YdfG
MPKIWFITGSSRGFGREYVEAALSRGDKVAATARNTDSLADLVAAHGDQILPLPLDVTDRAAVTSAVKRRTAEPAPSSAAAHRPLPTPRRTAGGRST